MANSSDRTEFYNNDESALPTMTAEAASEMQRAEREAQQQPYVIAAVAIVAALLIALLFVKFVTRRR